MLGTSTWLSSLLFALCWLGQGLSAADAATFLSFQEGDLRIGTIASAGTSGTLVSSSYTSGSTVLKSDLPSTPQEGAQLLVGNNGTATNRVLLAFDISHLTNFVGTNFARIDSAALILTHDTNSGSGSGSIQAIYKTSAFDETGATWNQPGGGAPAGGLTGDILRERSAVGTRVEPATEVWGSPHLFWGEDTGSGADMLAEAVRQVIAAGNHTLYLLVRRKTEQQNSYHSRFVPDEDPRVDSRPELVVGVDSFSYPPLASSNYSILAFADEFSGTTLDPATWITASFDPSRTNVTVTNGFLALTASQQGTNWIEGLIETRNFAAKYGYYEARLKLNGASGLNNAFWLNTPNEIQVTENKFDRTEIDITEAHHAHNDSHMTVHDWAPQHVSPFASTLIVPNISTDFHNVGLEWNTDNSVIFYWDGIARGFVSPSRFLGMDTMIPLAVLFSTKVIEWAGEPDANLNGSQMLVDFVRVRQKPGWLGAVSGTWDVTANWGAEGVPGFGRAAVFNSAAWHTNISLMSHTFCHSLYFDNAVCPTFNIASGPMRLHLGAAATGLGGVTISASVTNSQVLNANLVAERNLQFGNFSRRAQTRLEIHGSLDAATNDTEIQFCGFAPVHVFGPVSTNISRIIKWGDNACLLGGTNAHTGATEVYKGALVITSSNALGKTGAGAGTIISNGASLLFAGGLDYQPPEPLVLSGSGAAGYSGVLDVYGAGAAAFYGPIQLASNVTLACTPVNSTLALHGPISGSFDLLKAGAGIVALTGQSTFEGKVTVAAGAVRMSHSQGLGTTASGTVIKNTGQIQLEGSVISGEILQFEGAAPEVIHLRSLSGTNTLNGAIQLLGGGYDFGIAADSGELRLAGNIAFADIYSGGRTCLLSGTGSGIVSGPVLNGPSAQVGLTKGGNGRWTLSGTNGYTGPTTINEGELLINGTLRSAVTVNNGTLAGSGTISNRITIAGGAHSPGNPLGAQTSYGSYILSTQGKFKARINGSFDQHGRLSIRGGNANTVTLSGALEISALPGLATNATFIIIENDGADPVIGTFAGRPNNSTFSSSGYTWRVSYTSGDGNDVAVTVLSALKPTVSSVRGANATLLVSWPDWAEAYQLCAATNLLPPVLWSAVTEAAFASNGTLNVEVPTDGPRRFFRLQYP